MLTLLSTVKSRLAILPSETQYDDLLTNVIRAVSTRFDRECNRTLARTDNFIFEFPADQTAIRVPCYPLEAVTKFELKANEMEGWILQTEVDYLVRQRCVISLSSPLGTAHEQARVTCTGGYVLPGASSGPGQTALPADLEHAAVEQVAFWFQNRDRVGVLRQWPPGGIYTQLTDLDLLPNVRSILARYRRW